jgi:hypothetical protein
MQRPERVIIIGVSALACGVASRWMGGDYKISWPDTTFPIFETISIFTIPLTIMAFLANWTAIGRLWNAKHTLEARAAANASGVTAGTANGGVVPGGAGAVPGGSGAEADAAGKPSLPAAIIVVLLAAFSAVPGSAQSSGTSSGHPAIVSMKDTRDTVETYPIPPTTPRSLFYLQRTPNCNTIICELNEKNGVVDKDEPVHVCWIRYTEQNQRQELNFVQRHFAYGLKQRDLGNSTWELHFVSYKKVLLYLMKSPVDNRHHVYTTISGRQAILSRVYIRINPGGTFWAPNVQYLELKGVDTQSGKELVQRIKV